MKKLLVLLVVSLMFTSVTFARDLKEIRQEGVLRHIGVSYANFVTGAGTGLSVELIQGFADYIGVRYEFVASDWGSVISDLVGEKIQYVEHKIVHGERYASRGDLIANGLTIIPWRQLVLDFSDPTFPTQIWLIAPATSQIDPVQPVNEKEDILKTRSFLKNMRLLGKKNTCLDPQLYPLEHATFETIYFSGNLNDIAPAVIDGVADVALLDVPDALLALNRWPGKVKILGPITEKQYMGVGFSKESVELRKEFNRYLAQIKQDGTYQKLVKRYYPSVFSYYKDFFTQDR